MKQLRGKTAFVTGAASGIGLGIATALANAGVKVMLCDIEEQALDEATGGLRRAGADVGAVRADVSLKVELAAAAEAMIARFGKAHILVNNAGVTGCGPYGDWTEAGWDWTIAVNLKAVVAGVDIFCPLIESHGEGGHIVNTSSAGGLVAPFSTPYYVTKYGVAALSEGLRGDLAPRGIGVSVLCPGFVQSRILDSERNIPARFGSSSDVGLPLRGSFGKRMDWMRGRVANGVDPFFVGELVREAIENDDFYIMTDLEHEAQVEARLAMIKQGFDRVRGRARRS